MLDYIDCAGASGANYRFFTVKDGRPQSMAGGGYVYVKLDGAIPTIPYSAISAFLTRPSVLTDDQIRNAPHVVAFRDEHVVAGTGHEVYIADLKAQPNSRYSIVHVEIGRAHV